MDQVGPDGLRRTPPTPVIGMVAPGAFLILIEGLLELWIVHSAAVVGFSISSSASGIPEATIALAVLLLLVTWWYSVDPSWGKGVLFLILGALSFGLGAGFVVGGILIIVGGALACFADWVHEVARAVRLISSIDRGPSVDGGAEPSVTKSPIDSERASKVAPPAITIYRPCPRCGELIPRDAPACSACGQTFSSQPVSDGTRP